MEAVASSPTMVSYCLALKESLTVLKVTLLLGVIEHVKSFLLGCISAMGECAGIKMLFIPSIASAVILLILLLLILEAYLLSWASLSFILLFIVYYLFLVCYSSILSHKHYVVSALC